MRQLNVALDIEGVLADSHLAARRRSDVLNEENCPPEDFSFADEDLLEEYMHVSANIWDHHLDEIPPCVPDVHYPTVLLQSFHNVDLVTSRVGADQEVEAWLARYRIDYNDLHITQHPHDNKTDYGDWQVLVDDAPHNVEDAVTDGRVALLVDRPYNQGVEQSNAVRRVSDVREAARVLSNPDYVERLPLP